MHTYKINATKKLVNAMSYEKHSKKKLQKYKTDISYLQKKESGKSSLMVVLDLAFDLAVKNE